LFVALHLFFVSPVVDTLSDCLLMWNCGIVGQLVVAEC